VWWRRRTGGDVEVAGLVDLGEGLVGLGRVAVGGVEAGELPPRGADRPGDSGPPASEGRQPTDSARTRNAATTSPYNQHTAAIVLITTPIRLRHSR
jgi:hypothetical protein